MTPQQTEQADALRYRRAEEFYAHCREKEGELRRELTRAIEDVKRAKEKCVALFLENEARAVARRKSGQIVNSSQYGD